MLDGGGYAWEGRSEGVVDSCVQTASGLDAHASPAKSDAALGVGWTGSLAVYKVALPSSIGLVSLCRHRCLRLLLDPRPWTALQLPPLSLRSRWPPPTLQRVLLDSEWGNDSFSSHRHRWSASRQLPITIQIDSRLVGGAPHQITEHRTV